MERPRSLFGKYPKSDEDAPSRPRAIKGGKRGEIRGLLPTRSFPCVGSRLLFHGKLARKAHRERNRAVALGEIIRKLGAAAD